MPTRLNDLETLHGVDGYPTSILCNRARELVRYNAAIRGFTSPAESFRPAGTIHQRYDRGSINDNLH
ncbi:hypothetical protein LF1_19290 [Rubripirellula obstinata]|uniref:Uncharacterized protein n=1 Tax=Rubripirellula obstinata TaxID=406547 RepID=A0A5B1CE25_9BACT|nr:hypothetical protein LF1_19290 [Rubripirellula obstinata]